MRTCFQKSLRISNPKDNLIREAIRCGRVLIAGRGGSAKTVFLGRLAKHCLSLDYVPIFLSLKRHGPKLIRKIGSNLKLLLLE